MGNCFIFNPEKYTGESVKVSRKAGAQNGLSILLQGSQADYLCSSQTAGFRIVIHNNTEHPFPDTMGQYVLPGTVSEFAVQQSSVHKLPPPFGTCNPAPFNSTLYGGSYTVEACIRSCLQNSIYATCGCGDPKFPYPEGVTSCKSEQRECLEYFQNCAVDVADTSNCDCSAPCRLTTFESVVTTSKLQSEDLVTTYCHSQENFHQCMHDSKKDFAMLRVYYQQLSAKHSFETEAFSTSSLFSGVGAVLGTLLSFSVLTACEFIYLAARIIIILLKSLND